MSEYLPAIVTFGMLFLLALDVLIDSKRGIWHTFEIVMIVIAILALLWWSIIKTEGFV